MGVVAIFFNLYEVYSIVFGVTGGGGGGGGGGVPQVSPFGVSPYYDVKP